MNNSYIKNHSETCKKVAIEVVRNSLESVLDLTINLEIIALNEIFKDNNAPGRGYISDLILEYAKVAINAIRNRYPNTFNEYIDSILQNIEKEITKNSNHIVCSITSTEVPRGNLILAGIKPEVIRDAIRDSKLYKTIFTSEVIQELKQIHKEIVSSKTNRILAEFRKKEYLIRLLAARAFS